MASYTQIKTQSDASGAWSWLEMQTAAKTSTTVAGLPSAASSTGKSFVVTDATLSPITGLGLAVVGGNSNVVKVWSNGTSWLIG